LQRPTKRLFVDNNQAHGTVVLNSVGAPEREFTWYGEAFHQAGKLLVEELEKDPRFGLHGFPPDWSRALPIVYMYRHALELYLKGIIVAGRDVLPLRGKPPIDNRVFREHSLQELLSGVERVFEALNWDWNFREPGFRTVSDFRSMIGQFDAVDRKSSAFRYPVKEDGCLPSLGGHFRFNLFEVCDALDPIYPLVDSAAYGAREQLGLEYEQRAEARQYSMENADYEPPSYDPPEYEPPSDD
jgi:hypothetical protein